ncbi:hypothetical protein J6E39_04210 [bacterium]|nr:hypothetical protein [bacterium]
MTIEAIHSSNDNGMLSTVVKASSIGAGLGYLAKYTVPVHADEKDARYHQVMKITRVESAKIKADAIEDIRNVKNKSLAQDTFIKMIDNKEKITSENINKKIKKLGGENSVDAIEFKNIISGINESAADLTRRCKRIYSGIIKKSRPASPFIAAGALSGLFIGIAHNVLKTNTKISN